MIQLTCSNVKRIDASHTEEVPDHWKSAQFRCLKGAYIEAMCYVRETSLLLDRDLPDPLILVGVAPSGRQEEDAVRKPQWPSIP